MRIEPPPSEACAIGRIRAATDAAAPPDDPPAIRSRFHGLRVAPQSLLSVVVVRPNSGLAVLPNIVRPAALARRVTVESVVAVQSAKARDPSVVTVPARAAPRSFSRKGTPAKGPCGCPDANCSRAW